MLFGAPLPAAGPSRRDHGPAPPPKPNDAEASGRAEAPRRVLIVEDEGLVAAGGSGPAIVFLTANSDTATRTRAAAGARAFLTKPFHPNELEATLTAIASGRN